MPACTVCRIADGSSVPHTARPCSSGCTLKSHFYYTWRVTVLLLWPFFLSLSYQPFIQNSVSNIENIRQRRHNILWHWGLWSMARLLIFSWTFVLRLEMMQKLFCKPLIEKWGKKGEILSQMWWEISFSISNALSHIWTQWICIRGAILKLFLLSLPFCLMKAGILRSLGLFSFL